MGTFIFKRHVKNIDFSQLLSLPHIHNFRIVCIMQQPRDFIDSFRVCTDVIFLCACICHKIINSINFDLKSTLFLLRYCS